MSIIKTYAYKGITIDAVQVTTRRMSEADRTAINAWLDKHDVNVTIDTEFAYGIESSTAISVDTPEYAFYMAPGDWLAHDGEIFFHITDEVFRKHYREVNDEEDPVVYATGIDKFPPVDGLIGLDKLPPAYLSPGEWRECPRPRKRRGGTAMKAAYLDGVEIVTGGKKARTIKQALDAAERNQQAKETNQETYDRHLKLLDLDGHADNCTYCKDSTRNAVPPLYNKALADAVDQQIAGMEHRRGYAHLHMDRDGKITPARHLREKLERKWHPTPRKRADEWRPSLAVMAMYYNQFITDVKDESEAEKEREADQQGVFDANRDSVRSCLDAIAQLSDGNSAIQALVNQAENSLTRMHRATPTPTTDPEDTND